MNTVQANQPAGPSWRGWWAKLATLAVAMDYSSTDYLLDRINHLEACMRDMRADLDALRARGLEP